MNSRLSWLLLMVTVVPAWAAERPNVIVMLADDQGWGDLSGHGNTNLQTPHIDSLAKDGATFARFFVQPVCSPTRAEFLTGRYANRGGVRNVSLGGERLNLDEKTIADAFKRSGYRTGLFGKWHNGSQYPYHPNGRGFDEFYGYTHGHWGEYFDAELDHNGQNVRSKGYMTDDLTTQAMSFIKKARDAKQPFFCYLAFNTPHSPMQVPDEYWQPFANKELLLRGTNKAKEADAHTRAALAMCVNIDANVGRVLALLKEQQLERETIVVYFSDNGPNGHRWNGGMKGIKGSTDEGGVRSPLHVRWTGTINAGRTVEGIAAAIDLYPTLADLCGIKPLDGKRLDGRSVKAALLERDGKIPDRMLFQHWVGRTSVRSPQYRLDADGKLFDMIRDPNQTTDIAKEQPEIARRHMNAVDQWKLDVFKDFPKSDERPYPVGYREMPRTMLPARDGLFQGGIKRSSAAPNCSYFTNWTSRDDRLTWNIDVYTTGRYEAIMHYTAPREAVGSKVELACGASTWRGSISKAHDPALRGKAQDRSSRGSESFMKDFAPQSLGIVEVQGGRHTLTLRATEVAGSRVADVWAVELILQK